MEFSEVKNRAIEIRNSYKELETQVVGRPWNYVEQTQGLVTDVGELMELVMAKSGLRKHKDDIDAKIAHELSDILWVVMAISNELNIDIEKEFLSSMDKLEERINKEI